MPEIRDDHRGHTIFVQTTGRPSGPWVASYAAWDVCPSLMPMATVVGIVRGSFTSSQQATDAAQVEAKTKLDLVLDEQAVAAAVH